MQLETISGLKRSRTVDLVLVNSPLRNYDFRPKDDYEVLPPMGLAYIATVAANSGYNVGLLDAEHHGLGQFAIANCVNVLNPRYAGINVLTPTRPQALSFAKELNPDISLVIGGSHATALTEKTLREFSALHKKVVLIRSEAELAVSALLDGQDIHTIPGIFWLDGEKLKCTPGLSVSDNLDQLPLLNRNFLANDPSIDRRTKVPESRVLTSRGCPFDCTFCAGAKSMLNLKVRNRGADYVAQEIQGLIVNDNVRSIRFVDDLFISSEKRTRSVLDALRNRGVSDLYWDATGRASILVKFGSDFFDYISEYGANEIAMGIESGSERLRKRVNKQVSLNDIVVSLDKLITHGIKVKGYFIVGLPTETKAETQSTISLAKSLVQRYPDLFRASIFVFRPYPGTKEWNYLISAGFTEDELLLMHTYGVGDRAKHEVTPNQQFSESTPGELTDLITRYNEWQNNLLV